MSKREERSLARREARNQRDEYEQLCKKQNKELQMGETKANQVRQFTYWASENPVRQLELGEVWDKDKLKARAALTHEEEKQSALLFAKVLGVNDPISAWGVRTLRELIQRVFIEWQKKERRLVNPYSLKFDATLDDEDKAKFENEKLEDAWVFLEPVSNYDAPLQMPAKVEATVPKTAQAQFEEHQAAPQGNSVFLYSSKIMPRAGEE